jgi:CheB methylesterase
MTARRRLRPLRLRVQQWCRVPPSLASAPSAGGIEALEALFRPMPAEPGMAFVVVTHLGPNHESMLAEFIAGHTALPVHPSRDGGAVAINHIYMLRRYAEPRRGTSSCTLCARTRSSTARIHRIRGASVTNRTFVPRYAVEPTPTGPLIAPPAASRAPASPTWQPASVPWGAWPVRSCGRTGLCLPLPGAQQTVYTEGL